VNAERRCAWGRAAVLLALGIAVAGCDRIKEEGIENGALYRVSSGETIHVRRVGTGPVAVLLLPGNNCSGACFEMLLGLSESDPGALDGYTLLAFDYRGSGKSTYKTPIDSLEDFARDFDDVVSQIPGLGAGDAYLVGHSMGFGVAQLMVDLRSTAYAGAISLAGIGTRGVRVLFAGSTVGHDPTSGRSYVFGDWAGSLAAVAFHQRSWFGEERTRETVSNLWNAIVFNDVRALRASTESADSFGALGAEAYGRLLEDVLSIRYMPESLYAAHRFNLTDRPLAHTNADGALVSVSGTDRLDAFSGKRVLLIKAETDRLGWRGDLVIDDSITRNTKFDLRSAGADVTAVMIRPGLGYDHGFPLHHPQETWALIRWFIEADAIETEEAEAEADSALRSILGDGAFTRYASSERSWELEEHGGF